MIGNRCKVWKHTWWQRTGSWITDWACRAWILRFAAEKMNSFEEKCALEEMHTPRFRHRSGIQDGNPKERSRWSNGEVQPATSNTHRAVDTIGLKGGLDSQWFSSRSRWHWSSSAGVLRAACVCKSQSPNRKSHARYQRNN